MSNEEAYELRLLGMDPNEIEEARKQAKKDIKDDNTSKVQKPREIIRKASSFNK